MSFPLIVVDVQKAFNDKSFKNINNVDAKKNIVKLIDHWRAIKQPIIFIQHQNLDNNSLFNPKSETYQLMDEIKLKNDDILLIKNVNSSFIGTNLEEILHSMNTISCVIVGLTTNHCVETTTRMAGNLGFNPIIVSDACATFDRTSPSGIKYDASLIHEITMTNLSEEFATVMMSNDVIKYIK